VSTSIRPLFKAIFFGALILLVLAIVGATIMVVLAFVKGG